MASPTEIREPANRCPQCGFVAASETALKEHMTKHDKPKRRSSK